MRIITFASIKFHDYSFDEISFFFNRKSLICVPAAPALANLLIDTDYYKSLINSDINIFDSGFFCLLLRLKGINVKKFSGYKFLENLFKYFKDFNITNYVLVDPNIQNSKNNRSFLKSIGIEPKIKSYVAPFYNDQVNDYELLKILNKRKPKFIIINLGGGTQEKLGSWIKNNITYDAVIICTGAAISFFTEDQAKIGKLVDKLYLGWLARCFNNPKIFIPRYFYALKFSFIFFKFFFKIKFK